MVFLFVFMYFCANGYSTCLDTVKKSNCPNGFFIQVNDEFRCIDTSLNFYPIRTEEWDGEDTNYFMMKSINLQLLDEQKWYGEDLQNDRLRIFLIDYDSIVLYSVFNHNQQNFKLIKKEMPIVNTIYCYDVIDTTDAGITRILHENVKCSLVFPKKNQSVNYKQTEFTIPKKKLRILTKHLDALKNCNIFDLYSTHPSFVIEYFMNGNYYLLLADEPENWGGFLPEFEHLEKNCRKKDGLKILKWLKQY